MMHPYTQLSRAVAGCLLCCLLPVLSKAAPGTTPPTTAKMAGLQQAAKLLFTENRGQVVDDKGKPQHDVLFTAHSGGTQVFLTATGISYQFTKITYPEGHDAIDRTDPRKQVELAKDTRRETYKFSLTLAGANAHALVRKELKNAYTENFYTTGCLEGITNVGTYERMVYQDVYPHVDWIVYSNGNKLKYDFLVHPGGDPGQIKLKIDDAQSVQITDAGELVMKTTLGEVREQAPVSYAGAMTVKTAFKRNTDGSVGFELGAYSGELRIDPSVVWGTYYYGSPGYVQFYSSAVDSFGHIYAVGTTTTVSGVALNGYQTSKGAYEDMLVVKFDSSGQRIWASYYGGNGEDYGGVCTIDHLGNVYMCGVANSVGLATTGAYQDTTDPGGTGYLGAPNGLIVKFDANGLRKWATYFAGVSGTDIGSCLVDSANNIYVAGSTTSPAGIATAGVYQHNFAGGTWDGFLEKFDSAGTRLWGTYIGGPGLDYLTSATMDRSGSIYVTGYTRSASSIATTGTYSDTLSGQGFNAFLMKFNTAGYRLWGTYFGGTTGDIDATCGPLVDNAGNIYIGGLTSSTDGVATIGAYQSIYGGGDYDGFLAKFSNSGNRIWSTYYGGEGDDEGFGLCTDGHGNIYIVGYANSDTGIASVGSYQDSIGGGIDGFLANFDTLGRRIWATYLGGPFDDNIYSCIMGFNENLYVSGSICSDIGLGQTGAYETIDPDTVGHVAGLLVKFSNLATSFVDSIASNEVCQGNTINIPFSTTGIFGPANLFTAQLSDTNGVFSSPVNIGTLSNGLPGNILGTIPLGTAAGTGYRIRILSSSPYYASVGSDSLLVVWSNPTPNITYSGTQLCTGIYATYQWYINGVAVQGATNACMQDSSGGNYTVNVTNGVGCVGTSAVFHLTTGVNRIAARQVSVYPNPATNVINIAASGKVNVSLCSADGRQLIYVADASEINIGTLPNGVYLVKVYGENNTLLKVEKLVKTQL